MTHLNDRFKNCFHPHFALIYSFPQGLQDVSKYPALIQELLKRNWSEQDLADVLRRNFLRVFKEVENVS